MLTPAYLRHQKHWPYVAPIALIAAVSIGLYVWQFPDGLAEKADAWGQFGDFIGGVLNPLIGLVTILLVLRTIRITLNESARSIALLEGQSVDLAEQLRLAHEQDQRNRGAAELAELQKCLDEIVRMLTDILEETVPHSFPTGVDEDGHSPHTTMTTTKQRLVIGELDTGNLARLRDWAAQHSGSRLDQFNALKQWWLDRFFKERRLITELVIYVQEYDSRTAHSWVSAYYKRRAYPTALCLAALGQLEQSELDALTPPDIAALNAESLQTKLDNDTEAS